MGDWLVALLVACASFTAGWWASTRRYKGEWNRGWKTGYGDGRKDTKTYKMEGV